MTTTSETLIVNCQETLAGIHTDHHDELITATLQKIGNHSDLSWEAIGDTMQNIAASLRLPTQEPHRGSTTMQTTELELGINPLASYELVKVFFDDCTPILGFVPDHTWNGWAKPLIPVDGAAVNLRRAGFYDDFSIEPDGVHYIDGNGEDALAPRITLGGAEHFNFGELGLCWNHMSMDAVVVEDDGE